MGFTSYIDPTTGRAHLKIVEKIAAPQDNLKQEKDRNVRDDPRKDEPATQRKAAAEAGLSEHQEKQAVRMANVPNDEFEAAVIAAREVLTLHADKFDQTTNIWGSIMPEIEWPAE